MSTIDKNQGRRKSIVVKSLKNSSDYNMNDLMLKTFDYKDTGPNIKNNSL